MINLEKVDFTKYEVVQALIKNRNELESMNNQTNFMTKLIDDSTMNIEDVVCIYISLDEIIEKCNFTNKRKLLINLMFKGHSISEICGMNIGYEISGTSKLFKRVVKDINKEARHSG